MRYLYTSSHKHYNSSLPKNIIKISLIAASCVLVMPCLAADWEGRQSMIENGSTNKTFDRYIGSGKNINVNQNVIDNNNLNNNIVGALSDNNIDQNKKLNEYTLNFKDLDTSGIKSMLLAAGSYSGEVSNNTLNLTSISNGYDLDARGGHSYSGAAKGNTVNVVGSAIDQVLGGSSRIGFADGNKVIIKSTNTVVSNVRVVHGGRTWFSKNGANNNEVRVIGTNAIWVYGGESQGGNITKNKVTIEASANNKSLSRGVFGGKSINGTKGDVSENEVTISGSEVESSYERDSGVFGGSAGFGNANINKVIIKSDANNPSIINAKVYGAKSEGRNTFGGTATQANQNEVSVIGSIVNADIYGASSNGSNVILNKVYIQSDTKTRAKTRNLYGGKTMTGSANQNEVSAISSDIQGDIYGGYAGYGLGDTNENKITIENSNVSGSVYGGYNEGSVGSAINNIVNLKNTVMIGDDIVGGESGSGTHIRGNTLNIRSNKIAAGNVKNFETYNFYIPQNTKANASILTLSEDGDTDLQASNINVALQNKATSLQVGQSINLIKKTAETGEILTDTDIKSSKISGLMNDYEFDIKKADKKTLTATLKSKSKNPQGEALLSTATVPTDIGFTLTDNMNDSIGAIEFDLNALERASLFGISEFSKFAYADKLDYRTDVYMPDYGSDEKNIISFANIGGFKADYDKSNTDLKGVALSAGVAFKYSDNIYGAFIENGYAKFNSDKDGVTSDGKIRIYGLGFFSRFNLQNDFYIDATVKGGKSRTKSNNSNGVNYKLSTPYYGTSLGIGRKFEMGKFSLDSGANFAFSYVGSDEASLLGHETKFKSVKSSRAKIYSKLIYDAEKLHPYLKASYEYKFDSKSRIVAIQENEEISLNSKGGSAGAELGLKYTPTYATQINASLGQTVGKKDETSARLEFAYKF